MSTFSKIKKYIYGHAEKIAFIAMITAILIVLVAIVVITTRNRKVIPSPQRKTVQIYAIVAAVDIVLFNPGHGEKPVW